MSTNEINEAAFVRDCRDFNMGKTCVNPYVGSNTCYGIPYDRVKPLLTENSVFHETYNPLSGRQFRSQYYACVWTVLHYHRGGNWVCEEPDHQTTCHFHESEILPGLIEKEVKA